MKLALSRIVQGCMTWGQWGKKLATHEMSDLIHHCLGAGITSFDHADIYGDYTTEIEFGKAFKQAGVSRDRIQLVSKCGIQYMGKTRDNSVKHYQYDANYIIWSAEKSLGDLQADYLDLFLLHRPSPLMQPDEIAKAVDKLISEGKIKHFGVSNFTSSQMALLQTKLPIDANQLEFSLTTHQPMHDGTLDYMMTHQIGAMSWSPLGLVFRENNEQTARIKKVLASLTVKYDASEDQLLLAWILKHPSGVHPVIGTTNKDRIVLAARATEINLSRTDWFELWVAARGQKVP